MQETGKCIKQLEEAKKFAEEVKGKISVSDRVEAVICPPALYLDQNLLKLQRIHLLELVHKQCMTEKEGAFTGEVSPAMLQSVGVGIC